MVTAVEKLLDIIIYMYHSKSPWAFYYNSQHAKGLVVSLVSFRRTNETAMASFQLEKHIWLIMDPCNNATGSSPIVARWQRSFLAICAFYKLLTWHCTHDTAGHYAIACNVHSCGKVTPLTLDIVLGSM